MVVESEAGIATEGPIEATCPLRPARKLPVEVTDSAATGKGTDSSTARLVQLSETSLAVLQRVVQGKPKQEHLTFASSWSISLSPV